MNRRHFLLAAASSAVSTSLLAQNSQQALGAALPEPFRSISPSVVGEAQKVHAVISFDCPVCFKLHRSLTIWGRSLPRQFSFDFIPSVFDNDSAVMATAWLALQKVAPDKLPLMAASFFSSIQERGITASTPGFAMLKRLAKDIGNTPGFVEAMKNSRYTDLQVIQRQISNFKIEVTPSIVVAGRYVLSPENVSGSDELFLQVANGLVSKMM